MSAKLRKIIRGLGYTSIFVFIIFIIDDFILFIQEMILDIYTMVIEFQHYTPSREEILILQALYGFMMLYCLIGIGSNLIRSYPSLHKHPLHSTILLFNNNSI
ncbi:MAG: hypothetical protein ACFFFT_00165 [Candidatus Thorarchaeota archaeon]